ncbi:hypothetical protein BH23ACT12_BH23ACT12_00140 [soil metagenome]
MIFPAGWRDRDASIYPVLRSSPAAAGRPVRVRLTASSLPHLAFLAVATIAIFWRHLFAGYAFPFDYLATVRWPVFITSTVASEHFTEWIPFVQGGMALPYNAASGLYFPVWWVMAALHIPATIALVNFTVAAHFFLGAAGVFALARTLGAERRWAQVAGTAFLLFGGLYSSAYLDMIVRGHSYAPWLLWAMTPPRQAHRGGWRLLTLPLWIFLLVTGGYPGQAMAFLQVGAVYLLAQLWLNRARLREFLPYLIPAGLASLALFAAIFLPALIADRAGELYRPFPPSAYWRGIFALDAVDMAFGLFLDPFAWNDIPSIINGWAVGVVVLIGLTGVRGEDLRTHLPLVLAGATGFLLAFLPSWGPAGRLMASVPLLFPSRLPASDSKAMAAVALVILSVLGWRRIAVGGTRRPWIAPIGLGLSLVAGMAAAPQYTQIPPARLPWLLAGLVGLTVTLAVAGPRVKPELFFAALLALTVAEGARIVSRMETFPGQSAWALPPDEIPERDLHNTQARGLRLQLDDPPERRPARVPEVDPQLTVEAHGQREDALGYLGARYYVGDYASAITTARRKVALDPELREVMLEPWTAWVWSCEELDCSGKEVDLPDFAGRESGQVRTLSYGLDTISYRVELAEDSLMIENETWARGWTADRGGIEPVSVDGTLRGWVLPAGEYEFTSSYALPERGGQLGLAALALAAVAASVLLYRRALGRAEPATGPG